MSRTPELIMIGLDGAVPSQVRRLMASGRLPAFRALTERGCWFLDCRPPFPTITPTCWASLTTGALPATHGATCQDIHVSGTPLDALASAYHSANIKAERLWEAAARVGKRSLIVQMPTTGPAKVSGVLQVAGAGVAAIGARSPDQPTDPGPEEVPAVLFRSSAGGTQFRWGGLDIGSPASGQWQPGVASQPIAVVMHQGRIASLDVDTRKSSAGVLPFSWSASVGDGWATVAESPSGLESHGVRVAEGTWSPVLERVLATASGGQNSYRYRFKVLRARGSQGVLEIFFSEMGDPAAVSSPADFAHLVSSIPGVPPNHGHGLFLLEPNDPSTYLEAEQMSFQWQGDLLERAWSSYDVDIAAVYTVYLDSLNHRYRNIIEGLADVPAGEAARIREIYDLAYVMADAFLGRVVSDCGEDATYVVVSDHGSVGYRTLTSPHDALEKAGLLRYLDPAHTPNRRVDWARTTAWPVGTCHVYLNLEGRDPEGIVKERDRAKAVQEVIRALQLGFWEPSLGASALAFALPREQAGLVGLGGPLCGDVVYGVAGGPIGGHIGGVHACQIPTALTATGDIRSLLLISGPRFRRGATIERVVNLYDVAPTVAHALGYPQPAQAEGAVVFQALA